MFGWLYIVGQGRFSIKQYPEFEVSAFYGVTRGRDSGHLTANANWYLVGPEKYLEQAVMCNIAQWVKGEYWNCILLRVNTIT